MEPSIPFDGSTKHDIAVIIVFFIDVDLSRHYRNKDFSVSSWPPVSTVLSYLSTYHLSIMFVDRLSRIALFV